MSALFQAVFRLWIDEKCKVMNYEKPSKRAREFSRNLSDIDRVTNFWIKRRRQTKSGDDKLATSCVLRLLLGQSSYQKKHNGLRFPSPIRLLFFGEIDQEDMGSCVALSSRHSSSIAPYGRPINCRFGHVRLKRCRTLAQPIASNWKWLDSNSKFKIHIHPSVLISLSVINAINKKIGNIRIRRRKFRNKP